MAEDDPKDAQEADASEQAVPTVPNDRKHKRGFSGSAFHGPSKVPKPEGMRSSGSVF